ncbi:DUF1302 domain-containing protein [Endozoicomonas ascidiicola]|uniref:DUF1302 domain-containing protein n=1 Tax=Endozoicomonas ascidiicola TaxID=1698521 RepID=UPI00082E03F7|nr:DUF1302 family protein [Endozoicomonas ascidiicola]
MHTFKKSKLAMAVLSLGLAGNTLAGETIELGNDVTLDWKGTLTYSAAQRLDDQNKELTSSGNTNFDKGDLVNNGLSLLMESHLRFGNSGLVLSGSTFYDGVYHDDKFTDDAERYHGGYTRLLDAYVYTAFPFGESGYADFRLGSHVVAWGEALFFPSMSLAQGPSDAIKSGIPGTEVKDILLPEEQVSMQLEITPDLSLLAHYQYDWHETVVSEPGSYLSTSEAVGNGAVCLIPSALAPDGCDFGQRKADITPDHDQWGVGARYRVSDLTELGLYYLSYNSRIPTPVTTMTSQSSATYQVKYMDDIDLYGLTFTTSAGIASIAGEVTYKKGAPVLAGALSNPTRGDVLQTNLNAIVNFGSSPISDSATLTTEVAYVDIQSVEDEPVIGSDELAWTSYGLAASASLNLAYPGITESWDMGVPVSYSRQVKGRTMTGGVGGEGDHRFSIGADFTHHRSGVQVGVKYLAYMGDHDADTEAYKEKKLTDRDNVSLTVKYAF